jgi:hypothetical protein
MVPFALIATTCVCIEPGTLNHPQLLDRLDGPLTQKPRFGLLELPLPE